MSRVHRVAIIEDIREAEGAVFYLPGHRLRGPKVTSPGYISQRQDNHQNGKRDNQGNEFNRCVTGDAAGRACCDDCSEQSAGNISRIYHNMATFGGDLLTRE